MELNSISGIWSWFRHEVSGLVPLWFSEVFLGLPKATPLRFYAETETILSGGSTIIVPETLIEQDIALKRVSLQVVDVMFPAQRCFTRAVSLPPASSGSLEKMLTLDTLRATPFSEPEIYWSYRRDGREHDNLNLTQWIARREDIDTLARRLNAIGLRVRKVLVEGNETGRPLLDLTRKIAAGNRIWRVSNLLCILALIALFAYQMFYPAWLDRQEITNLNRDLTDLRVKAVSLRQQAEILRSEQAEKAALLDVIDAHLPLVDVLRDVTVAMSDDVWISDMNYRAPLVTLSGSTNGSAAQLVLDIAKSDHLQNPRLSGTVAKGSDQRERFELQLEIGARR